MFHLHGHHFRLLDRLDDGWKPFWLDTLAIEPGQTQRIAFAAEHAGRWLLEMMLTDWAAPRLVGGTLSVEETPMSQITPPFAASRLERSTCRSPGR